MVHGTGKPVKKAPFKTGASNVKDEKIKSALNKAIVRANSVTNALLSHERIISKSHGEPIYDLSAVVQDIAIEKEPLFLGGKIEVSASRNLYIRSALSADSLSRILSNVVDNAMLACEKKKSVKISVSRNEAAAEILIADTGRGIPSEIIGKIGQKGVSIRKKSEPAGTGWGVYSAKKALEEIGGRIDFESVSGQGTKVLISIPVSKSEKLTVDIDFILVDNEEVIQETWEIKASNAGLKVKIFSSVEELLALADSLSKSIPIFLDSDLGTHKKGESFALNLREVGFEKVYLTTAYRDLHGLRLPYVDAVIDKNFEQAVALLRSHESSGSEAETAPAVG